MKENQQSLLKPMENLKKCFSVKFLDKVQELGRVLPVNEANFYLVFGNTDNKKAAYITKNNNTSIAITELTVLDYNYLTLETKQIINEGCNENTAIWILNKLNES